MNGQPKDNRIEVRPMQALDVHQVMIIELGAYSYPWSKGIFLDCLQAGYCCWILEENLQPRGYGIMQVIADEAHVLNLCVDTQHQGQGFGRRLLRELMRVAAGHYAQTMLLEVRPSNKTAVGLYYSEGFTQIGRRTQYYPNHKKPVAPAHGSQREDALVLTCPLDSDYEAWFPHGLNLTSSDTH